MIFGYVRVSVAEQASSDKSSLQDQERIIRGVALTKGIQEVEIFADPGVSGAMPLYQRPGGNKMLTAAKAGDMIVASKLDRIFRSASDALNAAEILRTNKVDVIAVDLGLEPVTSNGMSRLFFTMAAAFAEFERGRIAERIHDGKQGKRERGGHVGGAAPYGYKVVGKGRSSRLTPDPAEQEVVADILKWAKDAKPYEICKHLERTGVRDRNGSLFRYVQVQRIIERACT